MKTSTLFVVKSLKIVYILNINYILLVIYKLLIKITKIKYIKLRIQNIKYI